VFKNKHQVVSQGNISSKLKAQRKRPDPLSFQLPDVSIYKSRTTLESRP
jgi:hypothetical protein